MKEGGDGLQREAGPGQVTVFLAMVQPVDFMLQAVGVSVWLPSWWVTGWVQGMGKSNRFTSSHHDESNPTWILLGFKFGVCTRRRAESLGGTSMLKRHVSNSRALAAGHSGFPFALPEKPCCLTQGWGHISGMFKGYHSNIDTIHSLVCCCDLSMGWLGVPADGPLSLDILSAQHKARCMPGVQTAMAGVCHTSLGFLFN